MIKINLLPRTIYEKRIIRNTAILFAVVLVAIIAAGFTYSTKLAANVKDMEQQAAEAKAYKDRVEQIRSSASSARSSIGPIKQKLDFINGVLDYNNKFPELWTEIAKWTCDRVMYTSLQTDGMNVQMQMKVKTLDDLGRYLLNMYRAVDLFGSVTISSLPGYPKTSTGAAGQYGPPSVEQEGGGPEANLAGISAISQGVQQSSDDGWLDITVSCVLKKPITPPAFAGAGAGAAAGAAGSPAGMMPPGAGPPAM